MTKTQIVGDFYESVFGNLTPCGNLSLPRIDSEIDQQMFYSFVMQNVLDEKAIRWQTKWYIVLDGYSSIETDFELVHYNGEKMKYKNFLREDRSYGYPFATTYGQGWIRFWWT